MEIYNDKKIILIITFTLLVIYLVLGYFNSIYYKQKELFGINSKIKGELIFKYESEANFLGDGITMIKYKLKIKDINEMKNSNNWIAYDYDLNNFINLSINTTKDIKIPIKGYYMLYDKQSKNFATIKEYFGKSEPHPYNYILSIMDFDKKVLYYYEMDT